MDRKSKRVANFVAVSIGLLYIIAGQAHFTDKFTPDLARNSEIMTRNSAAAMNVFDWPYPTFKRALGYFDFIAAALLLLPPTRQIGLWSAVVGFSGGLYGQLYNGGEIRQVATMLGVAVVGALMGTKGV